MSILSRTSKVIAVIALCFVVVVVGARFATFGFAAPSAENRPKDDFHILSPDGRFRAIIHRVKGNKAQLWLEEKDSGKRWQLTRTSQPFVGLTFTPDGHSLTYLAREDGKDRVATFDVNFNKGLASVHYNELRFGKGQLLAMPMWVDEDKLAYVLAIDGRVEIKTWSSTRGKHELVRSFDKEHPFYAVATAAGQFGQFPCDC